MRLINRKPPQQHPAVLRNATIPRGTPAVVLTPGWSVPTAVWAAADPSERLVMQATALARKSPDRVFCGAGALLLWGIGSPTPPNLSLSAQSHSHVGSPRRRAHRSPVAAEVRHFHDLGARGFVPSLDTRSDGQGFRVAPPTWCLWEVLSRTDFAAALATADAFARAADSMALDQWATMAGLMEHSRYPVRRERTARALACADAASESVAESMSRALILEWGFPAPTLQFEHRDARGFIGRSDFCWPQLRLIGEFDGTAKYTDARLTQGATARDVIRREKERENRLIAAGWRVVRWQWSDVVHPERLRAILWAAGLRPISL